MDAEAKTLLRAEEFLDLADGAKFQELVAGEVIDLAPAGKESARITMRLGQRLAGFVEAHGLGEVLASQGGYLISRDPDTVRAPDVSFISNEALQREHDPQGFFPGAPDRAVEVVSPSDRMAYVEQKVREYLAAGCKLVWVVLPQTKTIHVHRTPKQIEVLSVGETLTGEPVIPSFSVPVEEIFA